MALDGRECLEGVEACGGQAHGRLVAEGSQVAHYHSEAVVKGHLRGGLREILQPV